MDSKYLYFDIFKYKILIVDYEDRVVEQISRAYSSC